MKSFECRVYNVHNILSETVSQIKVYICRAQRFAKDFGSWKIWTSHLALTRWLQERQQHSSTIPPVTFKLMMASSNYCILWTDDRPHSATPTTVGNGGPGITGFCTPVITTSANNCSRRNWRCSRQRLVRAVIVSWCAPIRAKVRLLAYHVV